MTILPDADLHPLAFLDLSITCDVVAANGLECPNEAEWTARVPDHDESGEVVVGLMVPHALCGDCMDKLLALTQRVPCVCTWCRERFRVASDIVTDVERI